MDHLIDDADRELELPPEGHPLHKLGARLTELLDEDQWAACERLLLEGWAHDAIDRKTGANWRDDSSLQVWFPYTHEELARLRETLQIIADADWRSEDYTDLANILESNARIYQQCADELGRVIAGETRPPPGMAWKKKEKPE